VCRECGCTEQDCRQCIERTGEPCDWTDATRTLCTACAAVGRASLRRSGATAPTFDALLGAQEIADYLGVCVVTVRRMAQRGEFPGAVRVGREWRVPQTAIEAYLDQRAVSSSNRKEA